MHPLRILIVEDEFIIAEHLREVLERLHHEVLGIAGQVPTALEWVREQRPDLVLIDIMLRGDLDGIDLAARLRADFQVPFVFITSHTDAATVERAAQTRPQGYLVKPFKEADVYVALEMARTNRAAETAAAPAAHEPAGAAAPNAAAALDDGLFVRAGKQRVRVPFQDLHWLQAQGNYTVLHGRAGRHTLCNFLRNVEELLPPADFVRVHKSYIVARHAIVALKGQRVAMLDGASVPVGRTYRAALLQRLTLARSL